MQNNVFPQYLIPSFPIFCLSSRVHSKTPNRPDHDFWPSGSNKNSLNDRPEPTLPDTPCRFCFYFKWHKVNNWCGFLTRGLEIPCVCVCVVRVILTAVIISQSRRALPIVLGHDPLRLPQRSPKLPQRLLYTPHIPLLLLLPVSLLSWNC